ncbi:UBX domain-containing protein 1-like [Phalaenopsis equestris]|uniref:UBX domain-containing protein 1-like n=1 Tax=Phalaenopsis equestris TaxID=78828 RepID=UPI0009E33BA9|nr:UBX domain-containing protein 1-like [Phalaenopsis equestris]
MAALRVDKRMLRELESMGFPTSRATRALYFSGNSSIEDAIDWALEHESDSNIYQMPQVPIDIRIESGEPWHVGEEVKMKLNDLREQAQKKREEGEKGMERDQHKERIMRGKRLMEDQHNKERNERERIIAFRKAEKEEEKRARQKIRQQLELDKVERRRKLGLPAENPRNVIPTRHPIQEGNGSKPVIFYMDEPLKDCLRSLKKNHKDDDAKVKKAFQTLLIYIANVVKNPDNEKYRKIRLSNLLFQDRVGKFKEGAAFLELCGFQKLEGNGFLYMPRNKVEMKVLNSAGLALNSTITNPYFGKLSL